MSDRVTRVGKLALWWGEVTASRALGRGLEVQGPDKGSSQGCGFVPLWEPISAAVCSGGLLPIPLSLGQGFSLWFLTNPCSSLT